MEKHKAGFVTLMGKPNVGKSTLLNAFVGEKLAGITPKAQTTRHRILGIVNGENYQVVFSDTPGILKPVHKLHEAMMEAVSAAFQDTDILLYVVEAGDTKPDEEFMSRLRTLSIPILLLLNKIDKVSQEELENQLNVWKKELPNALYYPVSALHKFNLAEVFQTIIEVLPESPPFYPKDQLTDRPQRFFVNECIREKILLYYQKEIPYAVEVETETFTETNTLVKIRSVIMVERESQKGILIGNKGAALKKTGTKAREDLERFFGKKVYLELYVKVNKDWRKRPDQLKRFGYD